MSPTSNDARDRLLQSAIVEFAWHGYDHGTVRNICGKAEVNVNAVKYYFNDKRGLYIEAVREAHRVRQRHFEPSEEMLVEAQNQTPERMLRIFIGQLVQMSLAAQDRSDPNHLLIFREISNPTEAVQHIVRDFVRPHFEALNGILAQLMPHTETRRRNLFAFSVIGQCMHYKMAGPIIPMLINTSGRNALTAEEIADHVYFITVAAIEKCNAGRQV